MYGSTCQEGCTDCPACRGEAQPGSPAMHDMGFAMAMAQGASVGDRFWRGLSIAQTVRDGIRSRGAAIEGDRRVLDFLDGVATELTSSRQGTPREVPAYMALDWFQRMAERTTAPFPGPPLFPNAL